ncbi:MAG: 3-oxosteroid 1-dehydrogenase [Porticoccaceae bacterium]|nr:MAG: 3-oxosteroid 1-dehydrogenase [Porticoccaceae bacterium]
MEREEWDFIAVGSGGGALCAAMVLGRAGKRVLVLEKEPLLGGTTALSGGVMWIPNNRFMREEGVPDSREQALAYLDATVGDHPDLPAASRARREAYVDAAPRMVDFLVEQGVTLRRIPSWPDYQDAPGASIPGRTVVSTLYDLNRLGPWKEKLRPGFLPLPANLDEAMQLPLFKRSWQGKKVLLKVVGRTLLSRLRGRHLATAGQALVAQLLRKALDAGAEVRTGTPVEELVEEGGRITGVVARVDGRAVRLRARLGVLLNAGGFARNQAVRDRWLPGTKASWSATAPGDTGEMILEAARHGALLGQLDEFVGNPTTELPGATTPPAMQGDLAKPHSLVVDQSGARFMKEAASYTDICKAILQRNRTVPAIPCYLIMDARYLDTYMLAGTMPGRNKPKTWFEQGVLVAADSLEALAAKLGLPPERLVATVERFNRFCRQGRDEDFGRGSFAYDEWLGDPLHEPSHTLGAVEQPPFFAMRIYPGDVSTHGGVVTDEWGRVVREDGGPIPGLYATGVTCASVFGRASVGAGSNIGPALTWAWRAAHHALGDT